MSKSREMSFLDHLEELRWHILRSTISILLFATVAFLAIAASTFSDVPTGTVLLSTITL